MISQLSFIHRPTSLADIAHAKWALLGMPQGSPASDDQQTQQRVCGALKLGRRNGDFVVAGSAKGARWSDRVAAWFLPGLTLRFIV